MDGAAAQAGPAGGAKAAQGETPAAAASDMQVSREMRAPKPAADAAGSVVLGALEADDAVCPPGEAGAGAPGASGVRAEGAGEAGRAATDPDAWRSDAAVPASPANAGARPGADPGQDPALTASAPGDSPAEPLASPPADSPVGRDGLSTLLRRADFLKAASARRWSAPSVVVQARRRKPEETAQGARIGYTCSKKVGNAVARNRAKRRLRAAAAEALPGRARAGWDYVLIGRREETAARPFPQLVADLEQALDKLHAGKGKPGGPPRRKGHGRGKGGGGAGGEGR